MKATTDPQPCAGNGYGHAGRGGRTPGTTPPARGAHGDDHGPIHHGTVSTVTPLSPSLVATSNIGVLPHSTVYHGPIGYARESAWECR